MAADGRFVLAGNGGERLSLSHLVADGYTPLLLK